MNLDALGIACESVLGGGMYIKSFDIPAGVALVQHAHHYDHISILARGSVIIEIEGVREEMHAPRMLLVKAGVHHGVKALTDSLWYCCHNCDAATSEGLDESLVAPSKTDMQAMANGLLSA